MEGLAEEDRAHISRQTNFKDGTVGRELMIETMYVVRASTQSIKGWLIVKVSNLWKVIATASSTIVRPAYVTSADLRNKNICSSCRPVVCLYADPTGHLSLARVTDSKKASPARPAPFSVRLISRH